MPVYDFNNSPAGSKEPVCTYTVFYTNEPEASAEHPLLVLDNSAGELKHHSNGVFTNPIRRTAFEFQGENGSTVQTYFTDMEYNYRYNATGVGVYGKFGFIARPVAGLRIGGAVQTPTSTVIKEFWSYSAASYYTDSQFNVSSQSPEGQYRYRLISPFRFNVGAAYTFGSFGLVSVDYEMCDYSGMKFKETEISDARTRISGNSWAHPICSGPGLK